MPGTNYTTNLRLANPSLNDTGWGTTVSSGMIDLTDQAIAGLATADVTLGDVTLTIVDGSAGVNSARNMFLNITGAPGVARAVIVPTNRKLYFVTNNCGQIATVKVSGQTGVAVPAGASMTLRINAAGTDVAPTFTYAASMSLGTALPATSGGTGQIVYAVGDLLYASTTTALSKLAAVATGNVLRAKGVGVAPAWEPVALATDVSGTLPIANGGTGQTTAATAFDALKQAATDTYVGAVELATTAEVQAGTDTARAMTPSSFRGGALVVGTAQNTTSGVLVDFTGIPSWVKRVTVFFNNVSTSGSSNLLIQLGAGSITTTGYNSIGATISNAGAGATTSTTGFAFSNGNIVAGSGCYGSATFCVQASNIWAGQGMLADTGRGFIQCTSGTVALSGTLDRLRITTTNGTDTFDSGSVNIVYE
jgi:hypothetical protein